jgi:hypothetical protein
MATQSQTQVSTAPILSRPYALIAEFDTPGDAIRAAEKIRDAGFQKWDVHTPFAVHGMDAAMGLNNSKVGWFSFFGGCLGMTTGMSMIWFMNGFDYQIVVGGKPLFSPLYAFPVSYELTILFASFATLFGMFGLNRLPRLHHPLLRNRRFKQATHDKFIVVIETADPKYSETETRKLLETAGSKHIEIVEET